MRARDGLTHLAVDPGNKESGWVLFTLQDGYPGGVNIESFGVIENGELQNKIEELHKAERKAGRKLGCLCIEMPKAQGMAVANEVFETCVFVGRLLQTWPGTDWSYVFRGEVKLAICGQARAKDPNVRQALIDLWGGKDDAIGGVKCPICKGKGHTGRERVECKCKTGWKIPKGPLHGMAADSWAALAVAYSWSLQDKNVHSLKPSQ